MLSLVASPDGGENVVKIFADAKLYAGLFDGDQKASISIPEGRKAYIHLIRGKLVVNGQLLNSGDALLAQDESLIEVSQGSQAEVLIFDLSN